MNGKELKAMIQAALLGATHYQRVSRCIDGQWQLTELFFMSTALPCDVENAVMSVASWVAASDEFTRVDCPFPNHVWAGSNADGRVDWRCSAQPMEPIPLEVARRAAIAQHVREFVEIELTSKLEEQIGKALDSGAVDLTGWDGVDLKIPRALTTAILREAADRVIWERSHGKQAARTINNIRAVL